MEKIIETLFFIWLIIFPFGQIAQVPRITVLSSPEVRVFLIDLLTFLLGGLWFGWRLFVAKKRYVFPVFSKQLVFFLIIAAISLLFNAGQYKPSEVIVSSFYLGRLMSYFLLYFVLVDLRSKIFTREKLTGSLIVVGLTSAIFGLVQYVLWPDISFLQESGWDPHYYRVVGTFFDPGFLGIILVLTLILLWTRWKDKVGLRPGRNVLFFLALFLVYLSLMLTYSRSSYLALVFGMILVAIQKRKFIFLLVALCIFSLSILALPRKSGGEGVRLERVRSTTARFGNWQQSLSLARQFPVFGIGYNTYRYFQRNKGMLQENWALTRSGAGVDSSFLFVLITTGIVGLGAYLWLWIAAFQRAMLLSARWRIVVLTTFFALIIHSFFQNSLFYPWVIGWWVVILALI